MKCPNCGNQLTAVKTRNMDDYYYIEQICKQKYCNIERPYTVYVTYFTPGGSLSAACQSFDQLADVAQYVQKYMLPIWTKNISELNHAKELYMNAYIAHKLNNMGIAPFDPRAEKEFVAAKSEADDKCEKSVRNIPIPTNLPDGIQFYVNWNEEWYPSQSKFVVDRLGTIKVM